MAKRWTVEDDDFLARYYDAMGDYIGEHDLGRPKGAAAKRVKFLKDCGAWDAIKARHRDDYKHLRAYMVAVGASGAALNDIDLLHPGAPDDEGIKGFLNDMMEAGRGGGLG